MIITNTEVEDLKLLENAFSQKEKRDVLIKKAKTKDEINISKLAEIEHEHMHRNQGDDQPVLCTQGDNHWGHQGRYHDVVGCGRQSHSQQKANECSEYQDQNQVSSWNEFHELGHHQADSCQGNWTNDDTSSCCRDPDTNHVAGTENQTINKILQTFQEFFFLILLVPEIDF